MTRENEEDDGMRHTGIAPTAQEKAEDKELDRLRNNQLTGDSRNYFTSLLARRGKPHVPHEPAAALLGRVAHEIDKMEEESQRLRDTILGAKARLQPLTTQAIPNVLVIRAVVESLR